MTSSITGIHQTDFTPHSGNALQACVATVLGLSLANVPNFILEKDVYGSLRLFLSDFGLGFVKIETDVDNSLPFAPNGSTTELMICLWAAGSPRGEHKHVVVAGLRANERIPEYVFDPHPSGAFLDLARPGWVGLFVQIRVMATVKR